MQTVLLIMGGAVFVWMVAGAMILTTLKWKIEGTVPLGAKLWAGLVSVFVLPYLVICARTLPKSMTVVGKEESWHYCPCQKCQIKRRLAGVVEPHE